MQALQIAIRRGFVVGRFRREEISACEVINQQAKFVAGLLDCGDLLAIGGEGGAGFGGKKRFVLIVFNGGGGAEFAGGGVVNG